MAVKYDGGHYIHARSVHHPAIYPCNAKHHYCSHLYAVIPPLDSKREQVVELLDKEVSSTSIAILMSETLSPCVNIYLI